MNQELSPELKILSKWCAVLSMIVVIYPLVFLVPNAGYPLTAMSSYAQATTHTHLAGNTLLFFMVGFFFTFTRFKKGKKIWLAIAGVTLILAMLGLLFGMLPLIIVGYSIYTISMVVMAVGILVKI